MRKIKTYISLFSSAGVGCYGFKENDFECIVTNELLEKRINIQKNNNKCKYQTGYVCGDITTNEVKNRIINEVKMWRTNEGINDIDVLVATPPCQGMSVANHKKNNEIKRNSLVVESIKMIKEIKPKFFVFENVPSFMNTICTDIDGVDKTISSAINNNIGKDYSTYSNVINFKNYGANSSRTRTLVIGVRKDLADFISPIELMPDFKSSNTLRNVIGHLKPLNVLGEIDENDIYHSFRKYPEHMRYWIKDLKEGQSAFDNTDIEKIPHRVVNGEIVFNKNKNSGKYTRLYFDKVCACIHTRNDQLASQNTIHPIDDRVLSIRELMMLMNIPESFKWSDLDLLELNKMSTLEKYNYLKKEEMKIRQSIGEAVPTIIFSEIAKKINTFLNQNHLKYSEIVSLIEDKDLTDIKKLKLFIKKNIEKIGHSSLCKIAELSNSRRTQDSAYFTNKFIVNEIIKTLPELKDNCRILEPSVGVGNLISLVIKKYEHLNNIEIDVVDINQDSISILEILLSKKIKNNIKINYINSDFLLHNFEKEYDLVISNPPFTKINSKDSNLSLYKKDSYNNNSTSLVSFFIEKSIKLSKFVSIITPKYVLNSDEFKLTRTFLESYNIKNILDFGENGFEKVLIETICLNIENKPKSKNNLTNIYSMTNNIQLELNQDYITDKQFPYWIIYRNNFFDKVASNMTFGIFDVFRDRQIVKSLLSFENSEIRVLKSRNINDTGESIININNYDTYITKDTASKLAVYKYLDRDDVYLAPNMTYKPRVMKKEKGYLTNGSIAILIPKNNQSLTKEDMLYFSSEEYREFYKIARNYQTRSLNIDKNSVYFYGIKK